MYLTSIEGYTDWDIFHLYTTAPQSLPVFHQYLRNCVTYKYVLYIMIKVFLQCFYSCMLHKNSCRND